MWFRRRVARRTLINQRFRHHAVERLEDRLLLTSGSVDITLDPIFDTIGFQPETMQFYEDRGSLGSIFDTGASVVTFSALDQLLMDPFGSGTGIPIKVPGGAEADGIGGTLTGDVSQPGTVLVDGIHVNVFSGGDIFDSGAYFDQLQGRGSVDSAASENQLTGNDSLNSEDGIYNDFSLVFTSTSPASSANLNVNRAITGYDGTTHTFSFSNGFPVVPGAGDEFHIVVGQGTTAGPLPSRERFSAVDDGLGLVDTDGKYMGRYVLFTSGELAGQFQLVTDYDGATQTFELALPLAKRPQVGDTFDLLVGTGSSAVMPEVQAFVGTLDGSQVLPTISGTPMLNSTNGLSPSTNVGPQPLHPNGLALEVGPQGLLLDLGDLLGDLDPFLGALFEGITLPIPSVQFRDPGTELATAESFYAESPVVDPSQTATTVQFIGSSELPADPVFQDFFVGFHLRFLTGDLTGEIQQVSGYDAATRSFTLDTPFSAAPADGDIFELIRVSTEPITLGLDFVGFDNHLDPGDVMTVSPNPVSNHVTLTQGGTTLTDQIHLFDTGAQLSTISVDQALALGFDLSSPEFSISVQGAAGVVEDLPGFSIDELSIPTLEGGALTFRNVPVFVIDVAEELQGILGMNLFNSAAEFLYDPFDPMDPSDPTDDRPTLQMTFYNQRNEVAPEEVDLSELDPLEAALLESAAQLMPGAFGGFVGLTGIALPGFGVGVDLDLTPQNGTVREEHGTTVVTVSPGASIPFTAEVPFSADFYDSFQLDFATSDTALTLSGWNTDPSWSTTTDGTLSFPGDSSVNASGDAALSAVLGTFVVEAPATAGDYLLTTGGGAGNTQFTLTGVADPLPLRDFGSIIVRVQEAPSLAIGNATLVEGANGVVTDLQFPVTLTGAAGGTVSVDLATADGTARVSEGDYTGVASTLQFARGETEKIITVPVNGDLIPESDETFLVNLANPSVEALPIVLTPTSDVTGVDLEDDSHFDQLESVDANILRSEPGLPKDTFAMEFDLSGIPASATVTSATLTLHEVVDTVDPAFLRAFVFWYTGDADGVVTLAKPFNEQLPMGNQVGWVGNRTVDTESLDVTSFVQNWVAAGDTFAGFYIESALDQYAIHSSEATDPQDRPTLSIEYSLANATVELGDAQAVATIRNDDTEISISDRRRNEGDSGSAEAVFVLQLSNPNAVEVVVNYTTSDGTATAGTDYQSVSGTVVFTPGETSKAIAVPILGDVDAEPHETFSVQLSNPINATLATTHGTGTITDDDTIIVVGQHVLLANTADQVISIYVSGGTALQAGLINIQIADGYPHVPGSQTDGPNITAVDLVGPGTIFGEVSNTDNDVNEADEQSWVVGTSTDAGTIPADGLLATVTIDTTDWFSTGESWELKLAGTDNGDTRFESPTGQINPRIENGTIRIQSDWPYHNHLMPMDVNGDSAVTPFDAWLIINYLNAATAGTLPPAPNDPPNQPHFVDTNDDGDASPWDALLVIMLLNQIAAQEGGTPTGEGEAPLAMSVPAVVTNTATPLVVTHEHSPSVTPSVTPFPSSADLSSVRAGTARTVEAATREWSFTARDNLDDTWFDSELQTYLSDIAEDVLSAWSRSDAFRP